MNQVLRVFPLGSSVSFGKFPDIGEQASRLRQRIHRESILEWSEVQLNNAKTVLEAAEKDRQAVGPVDLGWTPSFALEIHALEDALRCK